MNRARLSSVDDESRALNFSTDYCLRSTRFTPQVPGGGRVQTLIAAEIRLETLGRRNHMSHEERRTARRARPLSLLLLAALLVTSCSRSENTATRQSPGAPLEVARQAGTAANANASGPTGLFTIYDGEAKRDGQAAGESYAEIDENPFLDAARAPLSTFSIDVDTASYSNTRRFLKDGQRPPRDAVRIEELVNYFNYDYPQPDGQTPFSVSAEVAECPWSTQHKLVHIGLQGKKVAQEDLPPANVVYAGASGLVLPSTPGDQRGEIISAFERLQAGGGTNGGSGIRLAYRVA